MPDQTTAERGPLPAGSDPWSVDSVPVPLPGELAGPGFVVTAENAALLAAHARIVQGGFSTPAIEAERLAADCLRQPESERQAFVDATAAKFAAELADRDSAAAELEPPAEPTALPIAKVKRYQELRALEKERDTETKAIKEEADALERELVEDFTAAETQNVNVGGKTVYLHRSVYAQRVAGKDAEDVKEALLKVAPDLVTTTVNSNTLSAWVREFDEQDKPLPPAVQGVLEVGERYGVRIIAGGSKAKSKTHSK